MKQLLITKGKFTLLDDDDYERLGQVKVQYSCGYASFPVKDKSGKYHNQSLHRFIVNAPKGMEVDHINGDRLDNRRVNLRICTRLENAKNRSISKLNKSGFKGVHFCRDRKRRKVWMASIRVDGKRITLGRYFNILEAALMYNQAAKQYHGQFAKLNLIF